MGAARFDKNSSKLQEAADLCWPVADVVQEVDEPLPLPSSSSPAWASKLTPENIERHTRPELVAWGCALFSRRYRRRRSSQSTSANACLQ